MVKKVAMVLSGSGHLDGSEIRETVITMLEIENCGLAYDLFAPDIDQTEVINHLTGAKMPETRNVLVESARLARGKISDINKLDIAKYDALFLPGGYGAAKNLSNIAIKGANGSVNQDLVKIISGFLDQNKPIAAMCIAPAVLVLAASKTRKDIVVTVGDDEPNLIESLGGKNETKTASEFCVDYKNKIVTCPAYMLTEPLSEVAKGIKKVVATIAEMI